VTKVVQWLTNVTEKLEGMNKGVKVVVVALVALTAAAAPMLIGFGMIANGIGSIITLFGTLKALLPVVTSAFTKLGAVLLANPIGIVIAAVTALVAAFIYLWNNCEGFRNFWIKTWEKIKTTAVTVGKAIGNALISPIKNAVNTIKTMINKIKSFFNFKWSLPKLKLPHISIKGKFKLDPPSTPKFSIKWYKKAMDNAMLLNSPTIFGYGDGSFLGGGEAGQEVVAGSETLMNMVKTAVASEISRTHEAIERQTAVLGQYLSAIRDNIGNDLVLDTGALVGGTKDVFYKEMGIITATKSRRGLK
jgi:hypothetical protein